MRCNKYGSRKKVINGLTFDSQKEALRWGELVLLQKAGKIYNLARQQTFVLAPAAVLGGRKKPALRFVADFTYNRTEDGVQVVEDVKSRATAENRAFRIKQHLMKTVWNVDILLT